MESIIQKQAFMFTVNVLKFRQASARKNTFFMKEFIKRAALVGEWVRETHYAVDPMHMYHNFDRAIRICKAVEFWLDIGEEMKDLNEDEYKSFKDPIVIIIADLRMFLKLFMEKESERFNEEDTVKDFKVDMVN